jgi:hypothetical protein
VIQIKASGASVSNAFRENKVVGKTPTVSRTIDKAGPNKGLASKGGASYQGDGVIDACL